MSLASGIVKRPVLGIVIFGLVAIVALFLVSGIPIDMFPEVNPPYLMVITAYRGAGPETVEKSVTKILESSLVSKTYTTVLPRCSTKASCGMDTTFS